MLILSNKFLLLQHSDWLDSPWTGFFQGRDRLKICPTGVDPKVLDHIGKIYYSPPPDYLNFVVHRWVVIISVISDV